MSDIQSLAFHPYQMVAVELVNLECRKFEKPAEGKLELENKLRNSAEVINDYTGYAYLTLETTCFSGSEPTSGVHCFIK